MFHFQCNYSISDGGYQQTLGVKRQLPTTIVLSLKQFDLATGHVENLLLLSLGGLGAVLVLPLIQSKIACAVFAGYYLVMVV